MPAKASALKSLRQIHLYFGLFISPALLFFAFTGAVQTLSLHEAAGSSYKPPAVLAVWGQIHKKQTWVLPARRPPARDDRHEGSAPAAVGPVPATPRGRQDAANGARSAGAAAAHDEGHKFSAAIPASGGGGAAAAQPPVTLSSKQKEHLPLKLFFLLVSVGLFSSTLTGISMAYVYGRNKLLVSGLLLAGVVLPLVLLAF